jgi:hypothetical protein
MPASASSWTMAITSSSCVAANSASFSRDLSTFYACSASAPSSLVSLQARSNYFKSGADNALRLLPPPVSFKYGLPWLTYDALSAVI